MVSICTILLFRLRFLVTIFRALLRRLICVIFVFRFFITILLLFIEIFEWTKTIHWNPIEIIQDNDLKSGLTLSLFFDVQFFKHFFVNPSKR